jgi:D-glycero-D-manno-heptose 1,7-bisphosphate phosphatase
MDTAAGRHPAIFIDRDGVIIHNRAGYVRAWEQVKLYPFAVPALARLCHSPYKLVIVTNQAAIGKGLVAPALVDAIHQHIVDCVRQGGGRIDGVFTCPHRAEDQCACRKPQPGLLLQAAQALNIDLRRSYIIGDALSDINAGRQAGVRECILVMTGRGRKQLQRPESGQFAPFHTCRSLAQALAYINRKKEI